MIRAFLESFPLPLSLLHPRWWLSGQPVLAGEWAMGYHDAAIDPNREWGDAYRNRGKDIIMNSIHDLLSSQSGHLPENIERMARQVVSNNTQVMAEMDALKEAERQMPAEMPAPIPTRKNLQKQKKKGSTRKRALTGAEAAERQERVIQTRNRTQKRAEIAQEAAKSQRRTRRQAAAEIAQGREGL
jgi:hypothetical protein